MKIMQINAYPNGSTGKIMLAIANECARNDFQSVNYSIYGNNSNVKGISNVFRQKIYALISRINGRYGFVSQKNSEMVIKAIKIEKPDVVVLHNIHDHFLDLDSLFSFLSTDFKGRLIMVFHDCWMITGYCMHFTYLNCSRWKQCCDDCPVKSHYSWFFDKSSINRTKKEALLSSVNFDIVTSSNWLKEVVKQSFLKNKNTVCIYPFVDNRFFELQKESAKEELGLNNKYLVLGVAFSFDQKKGIDIFERLALSLGEQYQIVLIGNISKKRLSNRIINISRTDSLNILANYYKSADVFVNPTREETFGMTNIEAQACGTPVVTFDVGGCSETICNKTGVLVKVDDFEGMIKGIKEACELHRFQPEDCIEYAKKFSENKMVKRYVEEFKRLK